MFLENKYTRWYFNIINNRKLNPIEGPTEKHHVIPKSMGGSNDKDNIVALKVREHFVVHLLLTKMTEGRVQHKMLKAAWLMACPTLKSRNYKVNSKIYETLRLEHSKLNAREDRRKKTSESMKKYQATNPWTPERREKQRILTIERMKATGTWKGS